MRLSKYNLEEDFVIEGLWFLDGQNIRDHYFGSLTYNSDNIILRIQGLDVETDQIQRLYGLSQDGKLIILNNIIMKKWNSSIPGYVVSDFIVNSFFIIEVLFGEAFNENGINSDVLDLFSKDYRILKVDKLKFGIETITDILNRKNFEEIEDRINSTYQFIFKPSSAIKYTITDQNLLIKEVLQPIPHHGWHSFTYKEEINYILSSTNGVIDFYELLDHANYIKNLYEFVLFKSLRHTFIEFTKELNNDNQNVQNTKVQIEQNKEKNRASIVKGRYYYTQLCSNNVVGKGLRMTANSIFKNFEDLIQSWYQEKEKLQFIVDGIIADFINANFCRK
ncbi:hypothetical protein ACWOE5_03145 [Aerococcus sanguinicola]